MGDEHSACQTPVRFVASDWPMDPHFRRLLEESWTRQYAEYLGDATAIELVRRLREGGVLYPASDLPVQLAMINDRPIGIAALRPLQGLSLVTMLEVLPAYRQQGIGRGLLNAVEQQAEARVMAQVSIHRPSVLAFYERLGFSRLSRMRVDHFGHLLSFDVVVR